jgi:hypothetical protein
MKKKINSNGSINNLHSLLTKGMTTIKDLHNMADLLGFKIDWIGFGDDFKPSNGKLQILNLGNMRIGGSHWCAVNTESKEYFDPLGAPEDNYIPKDYTTNNHIPIQNMKFSRCGQYTVLFLYYSNRGETDEFFDLFKIGYNE